MRVLSLFLLLSTSLAAQSSGSGVAITEYAIPTSNSNPFGITTGPDGALWLAEDANSKIDRITTSSVLTEYPEFLPGGPRAVVTGMDGAVWYITTDFNGSASIGRITTTGRLTEYKAPSLSSGSLGLTRGPDDNL